MTAQHATRVECSYYVLAVLYVRHKPAIPTQEVCFSVRIILLLFQTRAAQS